MIEKMSGNLHVKDDRTSLEYTIKGESNIVRASDLAKIKSPSIQWGDAAQGPPDVKLRILDPGYENTAVMSSSVKFA